MKKIYVVRPALYFAREFVEGAIPLGVYLRGLGFGCQPFGFS